MSNPVTVEDIKALNKDLPDRIREWLRVEAIGDTTVKVTPCKYLGDDWQQVMDLYDQHGGRWVSTGKDSHWVFNQPANSPQTEKPQAPTPPGKLTQTQLVQEGMALIEQGLAKVKEAYKKA